MIEELDQGSMQNVSRAVRLLVKACLPINLVPGFTSGRDETRWRDGKRIALTRFVADAPDNSCFFESITFNNGLI